MNVGPTYRRAARFYFEPRPRPAMAHQPAFDDQAHREPRPESLAAAVVVYLLGLPMIVLLILVMLWPVPA